jgi:hypothetical protein
VRDFLEKCEAGDLKPEVELDRKLNRKISLYQGDITKVQADVIVTAANSELRGGVAVLIKLYIGQQGLNCWKLAERLGIVKQGLQ